MLRIGFRSTNMRHTNSVSYNCYLFEVKYLFYTIIVLFQRYYFDNLMQIIIDFFLNSKILNFQKCIKLPTDKLKKYNYYFLIITLL